MGSPLKRKLYSICRFTTDNRRNIFIIIKFVSRSMALTRVCGLLLLGIHLSAMLIYALKTFSFYEVNISNSFDGNSYAITAQLPLLIGTALFVVVGFGLVLGYFANSTLHGMLNSLVVVSVTVIFCPIFQKFWYNALLADFNSGQRTSLDDDADAMRVYSSQFKITLSLFNLRIALLCSIAQLSVYLTSAHKISIRSIVSNSIIFNFIWNLTLILNYKIGGRSNKRYEFDDYLIANVYVFAAFLALGQSIVMKRIPATCVNNFHNKVSITLAIIGSFFLYACFAMTFGSPFLFGTKIQLGFFNVLFALSANMMGIFSFSYLLTGTLEMKTFIYGTIMGGVAVGTYAGFEPNIAAFIVVGFITGAFVNFYYILVLPRINAVNLVDTNGGLTLLVHSLIGSLACGGLVYFAHVQNNPQQRSWVTYILRFNAIALGIGICTGFLTGGLNYLLTDNHDKEIEDLNEISPNFGLHHVERSENISESAQALSHA